jgi:hypothetical protein
VLFDVVDRFDFPAENERDQPLRVELDDHVRPFINDPDVVFLVDAHHVRERRGVHVRPPLLDVAAVLVELEELRRRRALGGPALPLRV